MLLLAVLAVFVQLLTFTLAHHRPHPRIFFIRHGEEPKDGSAGLSATGKARAKCVADVFGQDSGKDIGYIMVPSITQHGRHRRSHDTVMPLAESLGIQVDDHCGRDQHRCVAETISRFDGIGNILIVWQHEGLEQIARQLGYKHTPRYPHGHFEVIWEFPQHAKQKFKTSNECCPGLDKCRNKSVLELATDAPLLDQSYLQEDL